MKYVLIILLVMPSICSAHGYPTIEEFQMFPGTFTQAVISNPVGGIVAIPFAVVGGVVGLIVTPVTGGDIKVSVFVGCVSVGLCGYMVGQQIGWPFYGIEKGIRWVCK